MYAEITRNVFKMVVTKDVKCDRVEELELAFKAYYVVDGVVLLQVDNYLSRTEQFYIQDINA